MRQSPAVMVAEAVIVSLLFLIMALVAQPARAETLSTISLTDSIRDVLRTDNDAIRLQDEKVKTAGSHVQEAAGTFDWTAQAQGGWQELYVPRAVYSPVFP